MVSLRLFAALYPLFAVKLQPGCTSGLDLGSTYKAPIGNNNNTPQSACLNIELFGGSETSWILKVNSASGSIDFGVSHLELIGEGWNSTGLFYNGNLHDGSGLLKGDFGPYFRAGDIIEMFVQMQESDETSRLRVAYKVNKVKLGTAFDLSPIPIQPLHVCVRLQGDTSEIILEQNNDVEGLEDFQPRENPLNAFALDTSSPFIQANNLSFPSEVEVQMNRKSNSLEFKATKGNNISVAFENNSEPYKLVANGVRSTRMMPPLAEVQKWEDELKACLNKGPTLDINEGIATIHCSGNLIFNSEAKAYDPVTKVERFEARIPLLEPLMFLEKV